MLAPIPWSGMTALVLLVLVAMSRVPVVGGLAVFVLLPLITAGYLAASHGGSVGKPISFIYLVAGWHKNRHSLMVLGVVLLLVTILITYLVLIISIEDMEAFLRQSQNPVALTPEQVEKMLAPLLPRMLVLGSLLFAPLFMAMLFAPGLALFEGFPAGRALWWSLWACWVNWRSILVYSLILGMAGMIPVFIPSSMIGGVFIPFGFLLLVFVPWTLTSTYVAYQDIFRPAAPIETATETA